ncbi:MAG: hypothetical protein Q8Q07_01380 [Dehalococcoidales bacterium]|nr:hypothetical protein [Dehalococcoidales bacterium]
MKRGLKITGIAAVIVFVISNTVFALSSWLRFDIPEWLGFSLYFAAFYVAPAALLVTLIGYIACAVKSRSGK